MVISFKFKKARGAEFYRPFMECVVANGSYYMPVVALLDSGADVSFVPHWLADELRLPIKGTSKSVGFPNVEVEVENSGLEVIVRRGMEQHRVVVPVQVLPPDVSGDLVVLGREGFFHAFNISFKASKGTFSLSSAGEESRKV